MIDDYASYDAVGLAELVRRRAVSPLELLEAAIMTIERLNPALNAVVQKHYDQARIAIARGLPHGRFTGVPFLLKDLDVSLAGAPLTNGSRLFAGAMRERDSTLVSRYKAAGLAILGSTNSAEMGLSFSTEPLAYGPTLNPWDMSLSPGGSSGGSAAAVASGMTPMAHATDGGGSIRQPAALTGLFGLKPSRGRTPPGPEASEIFFGMSVNHAITRSVRDSAALLDATLAPEPGALHSLPPPAFAYERCVEIDPAPLRIALQTSAFDGVDVEPVCREAAEETARLCALFGHHVEEAAPRFDGAAFSSAAQLLAGVLTASFVDEFAARNAIGEPLALIEPINAALIEGARRAAPIAVVRAQATIHAVARVYADFFARYDVILSPTIAAETLKIGWLSGEHRDLDRRAARSRTYGAFTSPYNAAGCPAMSLPFSSPNARQPVGVQFAAALGREDILFALAGQLERARPWRGLAQHQPIAGLA